MTYLDPCIHKNGMFCLLKVSQMSGILFALFLPEPLLVTHCSVKIGDMCEANWGLAHASIEEEGGGAEVTWGGAVAQRAGLLWSWIGGGGMTNMVEGGANPVIEGSVMGGGARGSSGWLWRAVCGRPAVSRQLTSTCFQAVCLAGVSATIPANMRRLASQCAAGYTGGCMSCLYLHCIGCWDER